MWKFGQTCHILDLQAGIYTPMDMAVDFLEVEVGNFIMEQNDQIVEMYDLNVVGAVKLGSLHPDIQSACNGFRLVRSVLASSNRTYSSISRFDLQTLKPLPPANGCCSQQVS